MTPNINMRCDFFEHAKTKELIALLGRGAAELVLRLCAYCGVYHAKDGKLRGHSEAEIEKIAGWWGKRGVMLPALIRAKFMRKDSNGIYCLNNWRKHQGHIWALKIHGQRMARKRWSRYASGDRKADATGIADSNAKAKPKQCSYLPAVLPRSEGEKAAHSAGGNGRFPMPVGAALPSPLFRENAEAMKAACDEQIAHIKKVAIREPIFRKLQDGTSVKIGDKLEPEAQAAVKAWEARILDIGRAMAG